MQLTLQTNNNITMITTEQHNHLVRVFTERMKIHEIKPTSKKYIELQTEFFIGAISILDMGQDQTNMSVSMYVDIFRGDIIKPITEKP